MELKDFELAMKNIPVAGKKEYQIQLLHSVNVFIKNAKWRAHFALNPNENPNKKNTYGFNSIRAPPNIKELVELQKKLIAMVKNVEYEENTIRNELQDKLRKEVKEIRKDTKMFVPADKTSMHYKVEAEAFEDLISREIHKDYRKSDNAKAGEIEEEAKMIAHKLDLADRIFKTSKREANITLKDTKPNFRESPSCRLINPTKTEIGKISKQIPSNFVAKVKASTKYNHWKNTDAVIWWFTEQPDKQKLPGWRYQGVLPKHQRGLVQELPGLGLDPLKNYGGREGDNPPRQEVPPLLQGLPVGQKGERGNGLI